MQPSLRYLVLLVRVDRDDDGFDDAVRPGAVEHPGWAVLPSWTSPECARRIRRRH